MGDNTGPSRPRKPVSLKVAGAWSGLVEVLLDEWTVRDLRGKVSRLSGFSLESINLISKGRILKDHLQEGANSPTVRDAGLVENSKVLVTRIGKEQANVMNQESERSERIARIKAAAHAMAKKSNENSMTTDDFSLELENQSGDQFLLNSKEDQEALMIGLMLHSKARKLIDLAQYLEALEVLALAEEAMLMSDPKIFEAVDNAAFLQLDTVWCLFMLRDIARLTVARERLTKAREGLTRSHGRNLERLQVLQGGLRPGLAVYVRLELLEGVVAYHSGHSEAARQSLISANSKYQQLQVSEEAEAQLVGMGFSAVESRRALRVSGQDIHRAVDFAMEEKRKQLVTNEEEERRRRERREQNTYGKTPGGKKVDMRKLNELASIGYVRRVAAETLRQTENNINLALDVLTNPTTYFALQVSLLDDASRQSESASRALEGSESSRQAIDQILQDVSTTSDSNFASEENASPVRNELLDEEIDIAANLTDDQPSEYDLEVEKEGEAISEYLGLIGNIPV